MSRKTYLFAGILFYLGFLTANIPATLLDTLLQRASHDSIVLDDAKGTLWRGSGTLATNGEGFAAVNWQVSIIELLQGRLHLQVFKDSAPMSVILSPGKSELRRISLDIPAAALSSLSPELKAIAPGGMLHVKCAEFVFSSVSHGEILIDWSDAASPLTQLRPLGAYAISIKGAGNRIDIALSTLKGPMNLQGSGSWSQQAGMHFAGSAQSANDSIVGLLRIMGKPLGNGAYSLQLGKS